jgi:tryptophan-rich sensory protein
MSSSKPSTARSLLVLAGFLLLCFGVAAAGAFFQPGSWYQELTKPSWNPPSWIFGPVWTVLYTLMAIAAWRVWRAAAAAGGWRGATPALGIFLAQLAANGLWSFLFFGLHRPALALVDILVLLALIVLTILQFRRHDRWAAWLLVPYLLWVSFATFLNFTLWRLNG